MEARKGVLAFGNGGLPVGSVGGRWSGATVTFGFSAVRTIRAGTSRTTGRAGSGAVGAGVDLTATGFGALGPMPTPLAGRTFGSTPFNHGGPALVAGDVRGVGFCTGVEKALGTSSIAPRATGGSSPASSGLGGSRTAAR